MQRKTLFVLAAVAVVATSGLVVGCASGPTPADLDQQALTMIQSSFREQGIAKLDRLKQDLGQAACSSPDAPTEAMSKQ